MGFMTNITLLNDHFDWVQKNPKKFVRAIAAGMNDGLMSEVHWSETKGDPHWSETKEEREARIHYVTVHAAQHADTPQVIWCDRNATYAVHELPYAIDRGLLSIRSSNPTYAIQHLRQCVRDLRRMADDLEASLDRQESRG